MSDNQVTHETLLLKWADCLDIPSGTFVNDDLRAAAAEIAQLEACAKSAEADLAAAREIMADLGKFDWWEYEQGRSIYALVTLQKRARAFLERIAAENRG